MMPPKKGEKKETKKEKEAREKRENQAQELKGDSQEASCGERSC